MGAMAGRKRIRGITPFMARIIFASPHPSTNKGATGAPL